MKKMEKIFGILSFEETSSYPTLDEVKPNNLPSQKAGFQKKPSKAWCVSMGEINLYYFSFFERGYTQGNYFGYAIEDGGTLVDQSHEADGIEQVFKTLAKKYREYAIKNNKLAMISSGDPVDLKKENFWNDVVLKDSKVIKAIEALKEAEERKHIWNQDFVDIKSRISRIFDNHEWYDQVKKDGIRLANLSPEGEDNLDIVFYGLNGGVPKTKLTKLSVCENEAIKYVVAAFVKPFCDLQERLDNLKPFIEKGRKPNLDPNKKQVFVPKKAAKIDIETIRDFYLEQLKEWHEDAIKICIKNTEDAVQSHSSALKNSKENIRTPRGLEGYFFLGKIVKNHETLIEKNSILEITRARDQFISKNLQKSGAIVSSKKNLKDIKSLGFGVSSGVLMGKVLFEFEDGSKFTVFSQLVTVYEARTPFYRFPTTFHDIKTAKGVFHKKQSEEWMNTEFI